MFCEKSVENGDFRTFTRKTLTRNSIPEFINSQILHEKNQWIMQLIVLPYIRILNIAFISINHAIRVK